MANYKGNKNLPTVLIMTYQVAEQGVNLPGFNYIINYSVSSDPSALEQRFGRIDRMDSDFSEIYSVFLISKDSFGIDFFNFHTAFVIFLSNILSYLPSRNVIFTKEFVERFYDTFDSTNEHDIYSVHLNELLENLTEEVFFKMKENKDHIEKIEDKYHELAVFCFDRDIWSNISDDTKFMDFKFRVKEEIMTLENVLLSKQKISNDDKKLIKGFAEEIDYEIGDKIFYRKCDYNTSLEYSQIPANSIGKLDVIECGEYIVRLKSYQEYCEKFKTLIETPVKITECKKLLNKHLTSINAFFEKKFMENDFDSLFEDQSSSLCISRKALMECIQDIPDLKDYSDIVMTECVQYVEYNLSLFQFFRQFKIIIKRYLFKNAEFFGKGFCEDIFLRAWNSLRNQVLEDNSKVKDDQKFQDLLRIYYNMMIQKNPNCNVWDLSSDFFNYGRNTIRKDGTPLISEGEKDAIWGICWNSHLLKYRRNFEDPFLKTMNQLVMNETFSELSEKFIQEFWNDGIPKERLFYIEVKEGRAVASNWYRLAYKFLQEGCIYGESIFQHYMTNESCKFRSFVKNQYYENCDCKPFPNDALTKGICDCMYKFYKN